MKFTVLGSSGFIGKALSDSLTNNGHDVFRPDRDANTLTGKNLGHVIYAIGMTGNFREKPEEAIDAHVTVLQKLIKNADFESWTYLSSTRVYGGLKNGTEEDAMLPVRPSPDTLYDLSKLLGESICLSHKNPSIKIARLSNVYGIGQSRHTFLGSILHDLKENGKTVIRESPESRKDYVSIDDVTELLPLIAIQGKEKIYNIASGQSVTHAALAQKLNLYGFDVTFSPNGNTRILPQINVSRIMHEFSRKPRMILDDLANILEQN